MAEDQWIAPEVWAKCEDRREILPGSPVVLSFDGSRTGDATVLCAVSVESVPHVQPVAVWSSAGKPEGWQVPIEDVEALILPLASGGPCWRSVLTRSSGPARFRCSPRPGLRWPTSRRRFPLPILRSDIRARCPSKVGQVPPDLTAATDFTLLGTPIVLTSRLAATKTVLLDPQAIAVAVDVNPAVTILNETFALVDSVGIRVVVRLDWAPVAPNSVIILTTSA
jgi:hypothetical protein